ncbi:MAG: NAD-dependent epimerase/dehydratase family protein [Victivallales bacterium]|nr:NAD-dependent epimerase/dehydratase family protein [Victivallales bacterium]
MNVLVLGGTGWLGHRIAREFSSRGDDVTILTRGQKKDFVENVSGIRQIVADKNDEAAMADVLREGYTHIIDSVPSEKSIELVFKYAKGLTHYLHCSSTGGYAPLKTIPGNETSPYLGFYGSGWNAKRIVDSLAIKLFTMDGFPATVIRPCYITGPGKLPLDNLGGRRDDFIKDIIEERALDLPDNGLSLLQPIHVDELARSFRLAAERPRISIGQIYNICLDHAFTLNRYLEITAAAFGKKPIINYMSVDDLLAKYGSSISELGLRFVATHMCYDISKARRDLGFEPRMTPEEAVVETALWAAKQQGLIK